MIKLLYWLRLLTRDQADRLQQSHVPLRASTLANAGLAVMVFAMLGLIASCTLELFSLSFFQIDLPRPPEAPPSLETEGLAPEQDARDAFRSKVDRLQRELDLLMTRQAELEAKLKDKTIHSLELGHLTRRLRKELRLKELEMDALTDLIGPPSRGGRRFVSGTTEFLPNPRASEEIKGFILNEEQEVKPATPPSELPAEVVIALTPTNAQPGDSYRLKVQIHNRGNRSIHITGLELTWSYAGKNTGGSIPFQVRSVEPRTTELLHQVEGVWFEDLHTATIIATVTLKDGGRLTNSLSWQGG